RDAFAFSGADAALMNYTNTQSMQKMHIAEANTFWLAGFRLPYYMTVIWMLTVCLFPLILLLSLVPLAQNVYTIFLQSQIYLWSWPPMFVIIHFFVSISGKAPISESEIEKIKITFSNIDVLSNHHANFAYTAGALAASVPFLAYFMTKGLSFVLNNAAQHFGGIAQSLSVGEAQTAATGNVSMASYNGWNMNYDNTNAHKFDTNRTHFEGMQSTQMPNGAISTVTQDGSHIANVLPAISNSAVSVHGSDRVVDSLHQSANESFANAAHLRTSADSQFQSGLNTLSQFSENDANDYRVGTGVSNSTTDSISEDLRTMQDSIKQYNQHHDKSAHIGMDAAIGAQLSSQDSLLGKGVALGTGLSAHGSINYRAGQSYNVSIQEFQNSSQGQSFHDAYQHMVQTAKSEHLDVSDVKSLNTQEQIAAHFSKGDALISQSSSEYSKGLQYQNAASHAKESASAIDSNLNQSFHNWVIETYGEMGERTMLQVDGENIARQKVWAEEFLNSHSGQSAVHQEVGSMLKTGSGDVLNTYQAEARLLKEHSEVQKTFDESNSDVHTKAFGKGQRVLSPSSMEVLKKQQSEALDIVSDAKNIRENSQKPIHNFKEK
ncbi:MAG: conjugal transfer protein TraG N-terminal domain-containing protein, partial [Gammaproteobacteria bacterium]